MPKLKNETFLVMFKQQCEHFAIFRTQDIFFILDQTFAVIWEFWDLIFPSHTSKISSALQFSPLYGHEKRRTQGYDTISCHSFLTLKL